MSLVSEFGTFGQNDAPGEPHPFVSGQRIVSACEASLSLYGTLDEFSTSIEPFGLSPYECLPSASKDSKLSVPPRSLADIWGQDTQSSCSSNHLVSFSSESLILSASNEYIDYSHLFSEPPFHSAERSRGFTGGSIEPLKQKKDECVVLCLSSLIR
jgi:hypothetical protein